MKHVRLLPILLLFGASAVRPVASAPLASAAAPGGYRIAPEDVLTINVVNFPNLNTQAVVPPDGRIAVPLLSTIQVTGRTTEEVAAALTRQWSEYVIHPSVSVALAQKHADHVYFLGAVAHPGPVPFSPPLRVLQGLAVAGGDLPASDLSRLTVTHPDGTSQTLDLSAPEDKGSSPANVLLGPDDIVQVPQRHSEFSVIGEVDKPGSYDYKDNMTVLDALTQVGGVKDTADLTGATLIHNGQERKLDLDAMLRHGDMSGNVRLAAGDRVMVPEANQRTYVFGSVVRPGYYTFKTGDRILDALNGVGGPTQNADLKSMNFIRVNKTKNVADLTKVNLEKFLKNGDMSGNALLEPGDVLFIADKKRGFRLDDVWMVLSSLSLANAGANILTHGLGH